MKYKHAEAFMLMRYEGAGGRREWIWNSRDGITPFAVHSADGTAELQHGNWHLDRCEPQYVPAIGTRVFVGLTEELARPLATEYVDRHWENPSLPMSIHPTFSALGRAGSIEKFVQDWVKSWGGHSPHVVVVTPTLHEMFKARAAVRV